MHGCLAVMAQAPERTGLGASPPYRLPMPVSLDGVRAKLARADVHVAELRSLLEPIVAIATASVECEREASGTRLVYRLTNVPVVPPVVAAVVGDVLQNLRSALDHLAWQLVLSDGGQPDELTQFPIYPTATNKNGNPRTVTIQPGISDPRILQALLDAQPFSYSAHGHDPAETRWRSCRR